MTQSKSDAIGVDGVRIGTFAALRFPNYRLWFFGQALSLMGTWMQNIAQGWVVFQLTGSEFALGAISFAGTLPNLFLMLPAGVLVDRISKRRLLLFTQTMMMVLAFILAGLAAKPDILRVWQVAVLAVALGIVTSFDAPARQALAVELVEDRRYLMNAIALNSTIFNMARVVGPAFGGVVLAAVGAAWCFGLNGLSFIAVLIALLLMRFPPAIVEIRSGPLVTQMGEGLRYVWQNVPVRAAIGVVSTASLFAFSYSVLLPAYAVDVLKVGAAGLGALNMAVGAGALGGSLMVASLGHFRHKPWLMGAGALLFPTALLLLAASRSLGFSLVCLVLAGLAIVTQNATANTIVQSLVPDDLRGRVMGVYTLVLFGMTPFGSLLAGTLAQGLGTQTAIAIDAGITLVIVAGILLASPTLRTLEI